MIKTKIYKVNYNDTHKNKEAFSRYCTLKALINELTKETELYELTVSNESEFDLIFIHYKNSNKRFQIRSIEIEYLITE